MWVLDHVYSFKKITAGSTIAVLYTIDLVRNSCKAEFLTYAMQQLLPG